MSWDFIERAPAVPVVLLIKLLLPSWKILKSAPAPRYNVPPSLFKETLPVAVISATSIPPITLIPAASVVSFAEPLW